MSTEKLKKIERNIALAGIALDNISMMETEEDTSFIMTIPNKQGDIKRFKNELIKSIMSSADEELKYLNNTMYYLNEASETLNALEKGGMTSPAHIKVARTILSRGIATFISFVLSSQVEMVGLLEAGIEKLETEEDHEILESITEETEFLIEEMDTLRFDEKYGNISYYADFNLNIEEDSTDEMEYLGEDGSSINTTLKSDVDISDILNKPEAIEIRNWISENKSYNTNGFSWEEETDEDGEMI